MDTYSFIWKGWDEKRQKSIPLQQKTQMLNEAFSDNKNL